MQKMRRGAVTLPGLSTVAVGAATPCEITGEGRDEAESENKEIIWGGRGEAREAEKQRATMGKFNKSGVNKKTFSAFWWTPGSISIASYLTQPSHTHTPILPSPKAPSCGSEASAQWSWRELSLRLAATCGELGSIDQRRWLSVLPPVEGGYRTAYTQTHAQAGDMKVYTADWLFWHWAEGRFGWLVGWLHLSIPPSLVPSPLPVSFYSTQWNSWLHSLSQQLRDNLCLVSFQHQHLAGWEKCLSLFCTNILLLL